MTPRRRGRRLRAVSLVLFFLFRLPAWAAEPPITTAHFIIHYTPRDRRLARVLAGEAERYYRDVVADTGVAPQPGIQVFLEPSHAAFVRRQPQADKAPEWAAGLAYPERNRILLKAPRAALYGTIDPFGTLAHELAHLVLHQALAPARVPRWLDEGFAMVSAREGNFRTTAVLTALTLRKDFIPLATLNRNFPVAPDQAEAAYAQSFSMVAYLLYHYGRAAFRDFLLALKGGATLSRASQAAFGSSFYELERRWHRYLRIRYTWIPVITSTMALWFLFSLLFLWVYVRKRRQARAVILEWEQDEEEAGQGGVP